MTKKKAPKSGSTKRGRSLHVGLNAVDPGHYEGWSGPLAACENDANDMASIARAKKIKPTVLLTKNATRAKVLAGIRAASAELKSGDLFFLTYSGHGGQVPDVTKEEDDGRDETWCLFDGELIDDELYYELSRFKRGVRILVLSDSCHSGTVTRAPRELGSDTADRSKMMPPDVADATYEAHKDFYDDLQEDIARRTRRSGSVDPDAMLAHVTVNPAVAPIAGSFKAASILISGCQDNQTSMDGPRNGAFTKALLDVWGNGAYHGDYVKFHGEIRRRLPPSQTPNLFTLGTAAKFLTQQPFSV